MDSHFLIFNICLLAVFYFNYEVFAQQGKASGGGSANVGGASVSAEGSADTNGGSTKGSVRISKPDSPDRDPTSWSLTLINLEDRKNDFFNVVNTRRKSVIVIRQDIRPLAFEVYLDVFFWKSNSHSFSDIDDKTRPIYSRRIAKILNPEKREKAGIPDEAAVVGIVKMIFPNGENCTYSKGDSWTAVPEKMIRVVKDKNPEFPISKDPTWYLRVQYEHYDGRAYEHYYMRADYKVVAEYN